MDAFFRRGCTILLLTAAVMAAPAPSAAQSAGSSVRPGATIRIWSSQPSTLAGARGDVLSTDRDGILLKLQKRSDPVVVPYDAVTRYDVKIGERSHQRLATILGLVAGAAVGAAIKGDDGRAAGMAHTALWGASVGGLVGLFLKTDRWETVPLHRVRAAAPSPGARLQVSLRF